MKTFFLAIKLLIREWRAGELQILTLALIIAVSCFTAINFYSNRLNQALDQQAAEFLGGDLVIDSPRALPDNWIQQAHKLNLKNTLLLLYPTMLNTENNMQFVSLKAVGENYPLYGQLQKLPNDTAQQIPILHTAWVEPRLLNLLNIKLGDRITIGAAQFTVTHLLIYEPDADKDWFNIAPRALINLQDVAATQTVLPGSRVAYRLLASGNKNQLQQFQNWLKPQLQVGQKILSIDDNRSELKNTLTRANRYLQLSTLICIILAGVAIAACIHRFQQRHQSTVALLRCLGLIQRQILTIVSTQMLVLGFIGSLIGTIAGYFLQNIFAVLFAAWWQAPLPPPNLLPGIEGFMLGLLLLAGFALPRLIGLKNIPALHVLRNTQITTSSLMSSVTSAIIILLILIWFTQDKILSLIVFYGLTIAIGLLYAASRGLIKLLSLWRDQFALSWRYGLANLSRRAQTSSLQLIAFGIVIMVVLLLTILRNNLIDSWQTQLAPNSPNYFLININPNETAALQQFLQNAQMQSSGIYPMVRGRLTLLNQKPIMQAVPEKARSNNALHRELNLTWSSTLPSDNHITEGQWWNNDKAKEVSVETKLAHDLNIQLNDQLTFQIGDQTITAKVTSLRSVEWSSLHPNFFMIFSPGSLTNLPSTYITSIHVDEKNKLLLNQLNQQFPSITLIDISNLMTQIKNITDKINLAAKYLLAFALMAGIAVLFASLQTSLEERRLETALLRTLGANKKYLLAAVSSEFICLGFLAGLLAIACALLTGFLLVHYIFKLDFTVNFWLLPITLLSSTVCVWLAGGIASYSLLKQSPMSILRKMS